MHSFKGVNTLFRLSCKHLRLLLAFLLHWCHLFLRFLKRFLPRFRGEIWHSLKWHYSRANVHASPRAVPLLHDEGREWSWRTCTGPSKLLSDSIKSGPKIPPFYFSISDSSWLNESLKIVSIGFHINVKFAFGVWCFDVKSLLVSINSW